MRKNVPYKQNPYKSHFKDVINPEGDKQFLDVEMTSCCAHPLSGSKNSLTKITP